MSSGPDQNQPTSTGGLGSSATELAFSLVSKPGLHAILIGSGVSRSAGISTGWGITIELCRQLAVATEVPEAELPDWSATSKVEAWYQATFDEPLGFSTLVQRLAPHRTERQAILKPFIESLPGADERAPTQAHQALAQMAKSGLVRVFVTTNFDRLLERALLEVGIQPVVLASAAAIAGAEPFHHSGVVVLKIHGDYQDPDSMLVTDSELSAYDPPVAETISRTLEDYALLACGWSGEWDPALRDAILATRVRYPFYFAHRGRLATATEELLSLRGASKIAISDSDTFFSDLERKTDALRRSRAPGPLDRTALIQQTKNLLPHPSKSIELDDLVASQTTALVDFLEDDRLFPVTVEDATDVGVVLEGSRQLAAFSEHSAGLASMFAVATAYEMPESDDGAWVRSFERVIRTEEATSQGGGWSMLTKLRRLPPVLIIYSAAIAAFDRSHFRLLSRLVETRIAQGDQRVERLLDPWRPFESDILPRLGATGEVITDQAAAAAIRPRGKFPSPFREVPAVSRLLHRICRDQLSHLIPDAVGFDVAFDKAELLLTLVVVDSHLANEQLVKLHNVHLGTFASRDRYSGERVVLEEFAASVGAEGEVWGPLQSGLFGGEAARATAALIEVRRLVEENP